VTCRVWNEDCIEGMATRLDRDSVGLTVTSPPFEELFTYSGKLQDVGNNGSTTDLREGRFALNLRFWIEQLHRVHMPGSVAAVHIQQLVAHKVQHGYMGRRDFRGALIDLFQVGGWVWTGEVAVPKDPQIMAQRTNLHSLQFKTGHTRGSWMWAPAPNDYVLIFRKPGEPARTVRPLRHKAANPHGWMTNADWISWASGVWDINALDVIDGAASAKKLSQFKESEDEKHVCPLQLELIRRLVMMYSAPACVQPDSLVLDPFMGVGSTAYVALGGVSGMTGLAVGMPRNVVGFELKPSYHRAAVTHARLALEALEAKETAARQSSLFPEEVAAA
jgi:DNA modification methylase